MLINPGNINDATEFYALLHFINFHRISSLTCTSTFHTPQTCLFWLLYQRSIGALVLRLGLHSGRDGMRYPKRKNKKKGERERRGVERKPGTTAACRGPKGQLSLRSHAHLYLLSLLFLFFFSVTFFGPVEAKQTDLIQPDWWSASTEAARKERGESFYCALARAPVTVDRI